MSDREPMDHKGSPPGLGWVEDALESAGEGAREWLTGNKKRNRNNTRDIQERRAASTWNGKGKPPSREVAMAWAIVEGGLDRDWVESNLGRTGSMTTLGTKIRSELEKQERQAEAKAKEDADTDGDGIVSQEEAAIAADANEDGSLDEKEGLNYEALIAGGIDAGLDMGRGAPLWPFSATEDPEVAAGMTVEDRSAPPMSRYARRMGGLDKTMIAAPEVAREKYIGARYFAKDALQPSRWSNERRAELHRVMQQIGLYGTKPVELGRRWNADDENAFATVMAHANASGLRWHEMLIEWERNPPTDILDALREAEPKKPTIRVTNPLDIRQVGEAVSQGLTGAVDRTFAQNLIGGYQGSEIGAQRADQADQEAGGAGVVAGAPSVEAYAEDQLRRTKPLEVDGYSFLGQFDAFLDMLGAR